MKATKRKIKWYEKPEVVYMTNEQLERVLRDQSNYFDVYPNAWNTDWSLPYITEAEVYDDEGTTYLRAKKQSKNSWRVKTTFKKK